MLLDLVEELVTSSLQLCRQRQEKRPLAWADSVEPVCQLFHKVHEQYVANFSDYRSRLADQGTLAANVEGLSDRLTQDHSFSADQLAKIIAFMDLARQQAVSHARHEPMVLFITAIRSYLSRALTEAWGTQYTARTLRVMSPVFRNSLVGRLKKTVGESTLSEDRKLAVVLQALDGIVSELQSASEEVAARYLKVRAGMVG
jgi:hypothetical protein